MQIIELSYLTSLVTLLTAGMTLAANSPQNSFSLSYIRMCLRQQFLYRPSLGQVTEISCAMMCNNQGNSCQGFWIVNSTCELFLFDQCSHKTISTANCTRFDWAFVRQQSNLPAGQLCPPGYNNSYLGSTYKMISVTTWTDALTKCSSEDGLTKFADGMDKPEVDFMHWMKFNLYSGASLYIGGSSLTSSSTGTWVWLACNVTFLPEVWEPGQPNGGIGSIRANIWTTQTAGVDDDLESGSIKKALCECVNPFV